MSDLPLIEGALRGELLRIALKRLPHEAVGIIYRDNAYELRNDHDFPVDNFAFDKHELRKLTEKLGIPLGSIFDEVILWHSHPGGGIGPSTVDIQHRTPLTRHLVVSLVGGDVVATWY